jgi:hypothetical protein
MEAAKLRAAESATNFQEASKREKKTQMKFHSWENQKSQLQEELNTEKSKLAQILKESKQAEMQAEKFEVILYHVYYNCSHAFHLHQILIHAFIVEDVICSHHVVSIYYIMFYSNCFAMLFIFTRY